MHGILKEITRFIFPKDIKPLLRIEDVLPIVSRTSKIYLTAVTDSDKAWQEKYARQKRTLRQGYFTGCTEPFRPVGGRILDVQDLIFSAVGPSLSDTAKFELTKVVFLYSCILKIFIKKFHFPLSYMTVDFPQESELVKKSSKLDDKARRQSSKPVDWENSEDAILSDSVRSHIRNAGNFGIFPNEN